jgi:hypothetical protein
VTGRNGEAALDEWSFAHFACGLVVGLLPIGWATAAAAIVGYEAFEGGLRHVKTEEGGLFEYESWRNIGMDVVLGLAGFAVVHVALRPFLPWPWGLP